MFSLGEINKLWEGFDNNSSLKKDFLIKKISTDSRDLKANSLFIPIVGKNFDGNNFICDAYSNGAKIVLVDKNNLHYSNIHII